MNRSARLNDLEEGIRLVVEIVPSDELQVGQFERSKAVIHLTKDAVKPEWWTLEVSAGLLGNYSSLKYKTFWRIYRSIQFGWKYDKECS